MAPTNNWDTARLVAADKKHVWHPFTPMAEWCAPEHEPIVLVGGQGALVWDSEGREYIDGNSSIWTNIHGHNHAHINAAIRRQLGRVAHTSFLGFTNPAAIELAESIVALFPPDSLSRVFFSDDGSTGMEAALRITDQHWRLKGSPRREFIAFRGGYHGDTAGAASLGAGEMFGGALGGWQFPARQVASVAELEQMQDADAVKIQAVVIEPLIQGAAGMRLWPEGTLAAVRRWCDRTGALLIADEVMTGFGRTGKMFACEHENVIADLLVLGKGLTGGYLPLAITVVREEVFEPFCVTSDVATTLFYGHSYTGSALGCAAAKASLEVFHSERVLEHLQGKIAFLRSKLRAISALPTVSQVRQCGFIAAIDISAGAVEHANRSSGQLAGDICRAARKHGFLTRPIREVIVFMPPLSITEDQLDHALTAVYTAITEVYGAPVMARPSAR